MLKHTLEVFKETIKLIVISLIIVLPIRYFVMQPFIVQGASMEPTYENGEYLIIDELSYRFRPPERGEVVVFRPPLQPNLYYIKRIIGLPEETIKIQDGQIIIFNKDNPQGFALQENYLDSGLYTSGDVNTNLGASEYFVLGDNRFASSDSRYWGSLPKNNLTGKVFLRIFPLSRFQLFN